MSAEPERYYYMKAWHVLAVNGCRNIYDATFACGLRFVSRDVSLTSRIALHNDIAESKRPLCPGCDPN